ncbi:MAG: hypothetical protein ACRDGL_07605, partial [Candidatus Limnocylindrales bacterium]
GPEAAGFLDRLAAVRRRLAAQAASAERPAGQTAADARTGERWGDGQVWAHLAEFQPYWLAQLGAVVEAHRAAGGAEAEPVPFGRTTADAGRAAAIEQDRAIPAAALHARVEAQAEATAAFLRGLDARGWTAVGLHPTLGAMAMPAMVERFLIGHLEEHADQLDALTR